MGGLSMAPARPALQQAVSDNLEGIRLSQAGSPGRSTTYQRFLGTPKELRSKGFTGRVRMVCVALDYKGTAGPLNCRVDSELGALGHYYAHRLCPLHLTHRDV